MWLPHPCLLRGPKEGGNATSTLHSRGSPTKGSKIRSGARQSGKKSDVATSRLPSYGPEGVPECYVIPAFLGIPNKGEQNQNWSQQRGTKSEVATSPMPCRGPKGGRKCYATPEFRRFPKKVGQNQKSSPTKGIKIRCGYLTHAFSGAQRMAEMLRHPCILEDPKQRGAKSEVVPDKRE